MAAGNADAMAAATEDGKNASAAAERRRKPFLAAWHVKTGRGDEVRTFLPNIGTKQQSMCANPIKIPNKKSYGI